MKVTAYSQMVVDVMKILQRINVFCHRCYSGRDESLGFPHSGDFTTEFPPVSDDVTDDDGVPVSLWQLLSRKQHDVTGVTLLQSSTIKALLSTTAAATAFTRYVNDLTSASIMNRTRPECR